MPESSAAGSGQALAQRSSHGRPPLPARLFWQLGSPGSWASSSPAPVPLHEGALHLGNDIRVGLGLLDAHGLVLEGEALHGTQGVGGAADLLENDKGLASHLQAS